MNNKLQAIEKDIRLVCVWVTTSNSDKPVICKWVQASKVSLAAPASSTTDEGRMRLCA